MSRVFSLWRWCAVESIVWKQKAFVILIAVVAIRCIIRHFSLSTWLNSWRSSIAMWKYEEAILRLMRTRGEQLLANHLRRWALEQMSFAFSRWHVSLVKGAFQFRHGVSTLLAVKKLVLLREFCIWRLRCQCRNARLKSLSSVLTTTHRQTGLRMVWNRWFRSYTRSNKRYLGVCWARFSRIRIFRGYRQAFAMWRRRADHCRQTALETMVSDSCSVLACQIFLSDKI